MSILVRYQPSNLTREKYDQVNRAVEDSWPPDGLELHVLFGDEGSLRVSEIWESEEKWSAFGEVIGPALGEAGIEEAGEPEILAVHNLEKH